MKDLLTGVLAVGLLCLAYFLNTKISGAVL